MNNDDIFDNKKERNRGKKKYGLNDFNDRFDNNSIYDKLTGNHNKQDIDDFVMNFDLKPLELENYLKRYVIDQDLAIQIMSTKICTHFNRLRIDRNNINDSLVKGNIKNNMLLIGPTGVGKTYIIKLIADKLNVPFSKGDATKFSETGYIGGDVDDLIRNLYRKCDGNIAKAEHGIVYVDEVDKIASMGTRGNGPDVSRGGVQRSLLKLMEESEVDIKTPHDIASQMESVMHLQKTGKMKRKKINTKNILFIFSGAFEQLEFIIKKRLNQNVIGFDSSQNGKKLDTKKLYNNLTPEDLISFGFESEFVGRLPIFIILNNLTENSLYKILTNEYSSIINSKKRDFESYGIELKFEDDALTLIAEMASKEKTGARALTRIVENTLIQYERILPSTNIDSFTVTKDVVENPKESLHNYIKKEKLKNILDELLMNYSLEQ